MCVGCQIEGRTPQYIETGMKDWNVYDILGVIAPGSVLTVACLLLNAGAAKVILDSDLSVGGLGLFALISYVAGNLVQAVANLLEKRYWRLRGGWPTDRATLLRRGVLVPSDFSLLEGKIIQAGLGPSEIAGTLENCNSKTWDSLKGRIYSWLKGKEMTGRVDSFNAQYGLNRGLAVGFLTGLFLTILYHGWCEWRTSLVLLLATAACLFRMEKFGHYYANELYSQFFGVEIQQKAVGITS